MTRQRIAMLVAFCSAVTGGCGSASSYAPHEPGRIYFVKTARGRVLERDGKHYGMSAITGSPVEAVSGDPVAQERARTYVRRTWSSGVLGLIAVALIVPAGLLQTNEPGHTGQRAASTGFFIAGLATAVAAASMPGLAQHHLYDAINIYNDNLARSRQSELPPREPLTVQPGATPVVGDEGKQDRD